MTIADRNITVSSVFFYFHKNIEYILLLYTHHLRTFARDKKKKYIDVSKNNNDVIIYSNGVGTPSVAPLSADYDRVVEIRRNVSLGVLRRILFMFRFDKNGIQWSKTSI